MAMQAKDKYINSDRRIQTIRELYPKKQYKESWKNMFITYLSLIWKLNDTEQDCITFIINVNNNYNIWISNINKNYNLENLDYRVIDFKN